MNDAEELIITDTMIEAAGRGFAALRFVANLASDTLAADFRRQAASLECLQGRLPALREQMAATSEALRLWRRARRDGGISMADYATLARQALDALAERFEQVPVDEPFGFVAAVEGAWFFVAEAEGWEVFTNPDGSHPHIERDDEAGKFASHAEALAHVQARAAAGSEPHRLALIACGHCFPAKL